MLKLSEKINNKNIILFSIVFIMLLGIAFCISYTYPRNIDYSYDGIKYQAENTESAKPISIYVEGELRKRLFNRGIEFYGKIIIGDMQFDYSAWSLHFDKNGLGLLDYRQSGNIIIYGNIFTSDMFKNITIEIFRKDKSGYGWNGNDGWLISAPCSNRGEAVKISNDLIKKLQKEFVIK